MDANLLNLFWEGFELDGYDVKPDQSLLIQLRPHPNYVPTCSGCSEPCPQIHDCRIRRVRERDLFDKKVWLNVPVRRLRCTRCGPTLERIQWLSGRFHLTHAMRCWIEALTKILPIRHVAQLLGLHWHTVKNIDKQRLAREVIPPDRSRLKRLIMDEFALHKGHRYATVAICADTQQVLWIGEGRSREAIRPFFLWLGDACQQIEAVAMDMNTAFDLEVQQHCPKARVVYDLFHVIAKYGREVIDRVRVDQANQLRHDKPARRMVKRSRWLLLRNPENLRDEQSSKLDELLDANAPLATVYILKAQLKELWYAPDEKTARTRWKHWLSMAEESGIDALQTFAKRLSKYLEGIVSSAIYRLNTSVLEGMNNKIKVLKRMAYGYRDKAYFFLKIKDAFPGKAR